MLLKEIRLRNFRVYRGEHRLELQAASGESNIYLIGGLNGAGKTSLFSAFVLCLYGRDAAGIVFDRTHLDGLERAYSRYVEESFSFGARAAGENEMSVVLVALHEGEEVRFNRSWWFEDGKLEDESLVIYEGNAPLRVHTETEDERRAILQEYIEAIAPARVAKFFCFDGEEIRAIASREPDQAVIEGLNQLLGFQTLRRLVDDLQTLRRSIRRELPGASESGLVSAYDEVDSLRERLRGMETELARATQELDEVVRQLDRAETEIHALFQGSEVASRSEALDSLAARERELGSIDAEIQGFVAEILSLALPARLLERTARRASAEAQTRRTREAKARLRPLRDKMAALTFAARATDVPLTRHDRATLKRRFNEVWDLLVEVGGRERRELFKVFTAQELEAVRATLVEVRETARRELLARLARRRHLQSELSRLRSIQNLFDTGYRAQALLQLKADLLVRRSEQELTTKSVTRELDALAHELATKQSVASRLEEQVTASAELAAELDAVDRLQGAVEAFMVELRGGRTAALTERITEMMRDLAHKEDLVHRVDIDPEDFSLRIFDRTGEEVLNPSAGEREVFALSLVWGLARISNRALPVLIDTPLGRLDQMHRANVVSRFLPRAGEQVLVLATDSEIDARWYRALKPHIAQEVLIDFSEETQSSVLRDGQYLALSTEQERAL